MIKNLFDNENAIFMGAKRSPDDCVIGIFGVNYDGTCSFKPGARFGPEAIRHLCLYIQAVFGVGHSLLKKF